MNKEVLAAIFDLLLENKEYPNYQAERRVDIFLNYFLSRLLSNYLQENVEYVCPEFPIKKQENNRSVKIDYLGKTATQPVFVEFKTDSNSLKEEQAITYLNCNWQTCVSDLDQIRKATNNKYRSKYDKLIQVIKSVHFPEQDPPVRVIYISPLSENWKEISIINPAKLALLDLSINKDEEPVWNLIKKLDLSIFEISKRVEITSSQNQ